MKGITIGDTYWIIANLNEEIYFYHLFGLNFLYLEKKKKIDGLIDKAMG